MDSMSDAEKMIWMMAFSVHITQTGLARDATIWAAQAVREFRNAADAIKNYRNAVGQQHLPADALAMLAEVSK